MPKRPDKILIAAEEAAEQISVIESMKAAVVLLSRRIEALEKKIEILEKLIPKA